MYVYVWVYRYRYIYISISICSVIIYIVAIKCMYEFNHIYYRCIKNNTG